MKIWLKNYNSNYNLNDSFYSQEDIGNEDIWVYVRHELSLYHFIKRIFTKNKNLYVNVSNSMNSTDFWRSYNLL